MRFVLLGWEVDISRGSSWVMSSYTSPSGRFRRWRFARVIVEAFKEGED